MDLPAAHLEVDAPQDLAGVDSGDVFAVIN